jgi:hypothetical protein
MKFTANGLSSPPPTDCPPGVPIVAWDRATYLTAAAAADAPPSNDEWCAFWWYAWRPAVKRWKALLHNGGGQAFWRLREVWDSARRDQL